MLQRNFQSYFIVFIKIGITAILCFFLFQNILNIARSFKEKKKEREQLILNNVKPRSMTDLVEAVINDKKFDQKTIKRYIYYCQKIVEFMPHRSDAHGLLGFCYYHIGKKQEAIKSYEKALSLNPHFFWFYYNLGLIHLEQGQYEKTEELFKKALSSKPETTLLFIYQSKRLYLPISSIIKSRLNILPPDQLHNGYRRCALLLDAIMKYLKAPDQHSDKMFKEGAIQLQIF